MPDDRTLSKLTHKYGPEIIDELNYLLLEKAKEQKLIRGRKLRVDTTVIESDIHHPNDADCYRMESSLYWCGKENQRRQCS